MSHEEQERFFCVTVGRCGIVNASVYKETHLHAKPARYMIARKAKISVRASPRAQGGSAQGNLDGF